MSVFQLCLKGKDDFLFTAAIRDNFLKVFFSKFVMTSNFHKRNVLFSSVVF